MLSYIVLFWSYTFSLISYVSRTVNTNTLTSLIKINSKSSHYSYSNSWEMIFTSQKNKYCKKFFSKLLHLLSIYFLMFTFFELYHIKLSHQRNRRQKFDLQMLFRSFFMFVFRKRDEICIWISWINISIFQTLYEWFFSTFAPISEYFIKIFAIA
jgi:hypothetical protein